MIDRLIKFYHASPKPNGDDVGEIWNGVMGAFHRDLIAALDASDAAMLSAALDGMSANLFGIENSHVYSWNGEECRSALERLAQTVGLLPFLNPEQPTENEEHKLTDVPAMVAKLEAELGFSLTLPDIFGYKLSGPDGGVWWRFLQTCAGYWSARTALGRAPRHTLEIGAGLGTLGHITFSNGGESYTVIDLPQVAVLSAFFAARICGPDRVWLYGEPDRQAFAHFYPCTDCAGVSRKRYDLVYNSDSLPELPAAAITRYLGLIHEQLDGIFMSINHESSKAGQTRVSSAVRGHGGFVRAARHSFFFREGYAEEIYKTTKEPHDPGNTTGHIRGPDREHDP